MSENKNRVTRPIHSGPLARLMYSGDSDDTTLRINPDEVPLNKLHLPTGAGVVSKKTKKSAQWGDEIITPENY